MGKYLFKYNYDTGDSFTNEYDREAYLELSHGNLDIAKENLNRIELHYKQYNELNSISWSSKVSAVDILEKNKNEPWFVKEDKLCVYYMDGKKRKYQAIDKAHISRYTAPKYEVGTFIDQHLAEYYIILLTDNNEPIRISCPWCGYFEKLNSIEIEEDISDRKKYFK